MYSTKLDQYGVAQGSKINATRFKERLLENCPDLTAVNHGREVLLTFNEHIGSAVKNMRDSADTEAIQLMHTIKILRSAMFSNTQKFSSHFDPNSQEKSVSPTLLSFVLMLLEGPGVCHSRNNQAALSIAQLLVFNSVKRAHSVSASSVRHNLSQETPLPIYVGLMLHSATRKKKLVDRCSALGLSVSYDRVMQIGNKTANSVCAKYRADDVVCPPVLRDDLFTVAAVDNIDHNMSSTTATSTFHGTAISLMQFPTVENSLTRSDASLDVASDSVSDIILPQCYTDVLPCIIPVTGPKIPAVEFSITYTDNLVSDEFQWLSHVHLSLDSATESESLSWEAFHANWVTKGNVCHQLVQSCHYLSTMLTQQQ